MTNWEKLISDYGWAVYSNDDDLTIDTANTLRSAINTLHNQNEGLRDALIDMLLLIGEHGSPTMKAHATRLQKAHRATETELWKKN